MDLTAFLKARLDEDERIARADYDHPDFYGTGGRNSEAFWAQFDSERVLREVEAKRATLAAFTAAEADLPRGFRDDWADSAVAYKHGAYDALRAAVLRDAAIYQDHPAYQSEWGAVI